MLYQLSGDAKYAEFGKQCFEKAFAGIRDCDDRYSWKEPGGALHAGSSLTWYALGYDPCYDGWDEAFRKKVADELLNYGKDNTSEHCKMAGMAAGKRQHPGSNHWGAKIAGPPMALLAIKGDPGVDAKKVDGNKLVIGGQTVVLEGGNLTFDK